MFCIRKGDKDGNPYLFFGGNYLKLNIVLKNVFLIIKTMNILSSIKSFFSLHEMTYYQKNKQKYFDRSMEYVYCPTCDKKYRRAYIYSHRKTRKHQDRVSLKF